LTGPKLDFCHFEGREKLAGHKGHYAEIASLRLGLIAAKLFAEFMASAANQAAGAKPVKSISRKGLGNFEKASFCPVVSKTQSSHRQRRTVVITSEKVVVCLPTQLSW